MSEIGIIIKGPDGVRETIDGLLLLTLTLATINTVLSRLRQPSSMRSLSV